MSGMMMALFGSGNLVLPASLAAGNSTNTSAVGSGSKTASITFKADGTIVYSNFISGPSQWANTTSAGIGTGIWVRCTPTTGTFTTNPAASFVQLTSDQTVGNTTTLGKDTIFTVEFSYDGVNTALTSTGWETLVDRI